MTITLSQHDYWILFQAAEEQTLPTTPTDGFDCIFQYPESLGQGYWRTLQLRDGVQLAIAHYQLHDAVTLQLPERDHPIEYSFHLAGGYNSSQQSVRSGQYVLYGSGTAPNEVTEWLEGEQVDVNVHIDPNVFAAWLNQPDLPATLQRLVQDTPHLYHVFAGAITSAMQTTLHQILNCPFQGMTKRLYLESKVWELMALLLEQELEQRSDERPAYCLKPDDIDRIHQAKTILVQQLDNPPSLIELARQVGLNDCTLKRGFRQVFGTTAFGYLHEHRLEHARQLLDERHWSVSEIAKQVGFVNRSYFAAAFRKKFGVSPREYLSTHRNSA